MMPIGSAQSNEMIDGQALWPRLLLDFARQDKGGIAIMFAMAVPMLLFTVGFTVDYAIATKQRQSLQLAADAAALAGAKGLSLADSKRENVDSVVKAVVYSYVDSNSNSHASQSIAISTATRDSPLEVTVGLAQSVATPFGGGFGLLSPSLWVSATARVVGRPNICILGLDASEGGTISLEKNARVTGQNCAVYSNSSHTLSIKSKNSSNLSASFICTVGGKDGRPGNFNPEPYTDCPSFEDPLKGRPEPIAGACDESLEIDITTSRTLRPGTYCGGLRIRNGARVVLSSGIYVIKDGPLLVEDTASLIGEHVAFYFSGDAAVFTFERPTTIELSAPKTGVMAGLLMFGSRSQSEKNQYKILSDNARMLLGTIYLPRGTIHVDANQPIADKSAYTAIVARKVTLYGGPHLVLNTNYEQATVPVPDGIKGAGQPVRLSK